MKPDWDKLANKLKDAKKVQIADVDCTVQTNQGLCQQEGVKGYPTVKYYNADTGRGEPYQGGRDYNSLYNFIRKKAAARKKREEKAAEDAVDTQKVLEKLEAMDKTELGTFCASSISENINDKSMKK